MNDPHATPGDLPRARGPLPALLRRAAAARYLDVGISTLDRLNAAGLVPRPIRLGGSLAWSRVELAAWVAHGCPGRDEWSARWSAIVALRTGRRVR